MHAFLDTQCTHICKHMHRHVNTLRNTFIPLLIDQRNDLLLEVVAVLAVHCIQRRVVLTNKWLSLFYFSIKIWPMRFIGMKWASILKDSSVEVSEGCKGDMKESTESLLLLSLSPCFSLSKCMCLCMSICTLGLNVHVKISISFSRKVLKIIRIYVFSKE